jgi:uncharacterized protein (DUF2336 family)
MAATESAALIAELEGAFDGRLPERWARILRQVTQLFLADAHRFNKRQIDLFDDVFLRLMEGADSPALAVLSNDLCRASAGPRKALRRLAFHEDVAVAGPVLRRSRGLPDEDLVDIANARGQEHLLELCARQTVPAPLSDKLVERGETAVLGRLIQNSGASFSEAGCAALVAKAKLDAGLAEALVRRSDLSPALRKELVAKVGDTRMRSMQAKSPTLQGKIKAAIATSGERTKPTPTQADYAAALSRMAELGRKGGVNDRSVNRFAVEHEYVDVAAALSFLSGTPVEVIVPVIESPDIEGLMVACKAARLNWSTTTMIIRHRPGCSPVASQELEQARAAFDALSLSVAQRTIRLW